MEFCQKFRNPFLDMIFEKKKIKFFVIFRAYNLNHVSYDSNFFTDVKNYCERTF